MRRLVLKILALAAAALAVQVVVPGSSSGVLHMLRQAERSLEEGADTVYFGDSVLNYVDPTDTDKRMLPTMLDDALGGGRVVPLQHAGYTMAVFEGFGRPLATAPKRPAYAVIPVNIAGFSPAGMRAQYQFAQERYLLRWARNPLMRSLWRPLFVLNTFHTITENEFLATPVYDGTTKVGEVRDFPYYGNDPDADLSVEERTARLFLVHYMGAIPAEHPKAVALANLCRTLTDAGIGCIVYISPVDCEDGVKALGPRFLRQVRRNVAVVRSVVPARNTVFLDLSEDLKAEQFSTEPKPATHLGQSGRLHVARKVAAALKGFSGEGKAGR